MKKFNLFFGFILLLLLLMSCIKEENFVPTQDNPDKAQLKSGAIQISGTGIFANNATCNSPANGADFALALTGDITGCLFTYVESYTCSPSGTYRESGREYFVGTYNGASGTFWTTYNFSGKYEGCEEGFFVGAEIFGRCQHPITNGTGTGAFSGVKGRLDFKDNVQTGIFTYRGHLKF